MLVEQRNIEIIAGAGARQSRRRQQRSAGSPIIMPPISTAPRSTRAAPRRCSRTSPRIARHRQTGATLSAALGASMRADVDPLNATSFGTENLFGVFVAQGLQEPNRNMAYLLQGGLGLPDRDYYLSDDAGDGPGPRRLSRLYRPDADPDGRARRRGARAERIFELETKIARAHVDAVAAQDPHRRPDLAPRRIRHPRARHRLGRLLRAPRGSPAQDEIIAWHAEPVRGLSALVAQRAARGLEGLARLPHRQPLRPRCCRRPMTICASPSTAASSPARSSSGRASAAPSRRPATR